MLFGGYISAQVARAKREKEREEEAVSKFRFFENARIQKGCCFIGMSSVLGELTLFFAYKEEGSDEDSVYQLWADGSGGWITRAEFEACNPQPITLKSLKYKLESK